MRSDEGRSFVVKKFLQHNQKYCAVPAGCCTEAFGGMKSGCERRKADIAASARDRLVRALPRSRPVPKPKIRAFLNDSHPPNLLKSLSQK